MDTIEGPVMVIAGPGTGKTQILTLRIANILRETDTEPENILALTFTEAGVASMRQRLAEMIGSSAYSVEINTFHGFSNDIIKQYSEFFPRIVSARNITEAEQVIILRPIISKLSLKLLKPFGEPLHYLRSILAGINDLKREAVIYDKGIHQGKVGELFKVYGAYQKQLQKQKIYDYNDMIMEVAEALKKSKELLLMLQEKCQYILVDEHQDTNNVQNKILEMLASFHQNPNLFVVGDDKQAIFRFQGASLENFLYFKRRYPRAKLIYLEENYRSNQAILDSAHSLLAGKKSLKARAKHPYKKITLAKLSSADTEAFFVVSKIKELIEAGTLPHEIAVLCRDNKDVFLFIPFFQKLGVPFIIESDQNILADIEIKKFVVLLKAINEIDSDEKLVQALHLNFLGLEPLDIFKLIRSKNLLEKSKIYQKLAHWHSLKYNTNITELFEIIMQESGLLAYLMTQPDMADKLDHFSTLFDELKSYIERNRSADLSDFLSYLSILEEQNLLIKKSSLNISGKVRLMTAHRSKGREFEYVFIVQVYNGHWGGRRMSNKIYLDQHDPNEDERRLFYVSLTRAKKEVFVSYPGQNISGRTLMPSKFIAEIRPELIDIISTEAIEEEFYKKRSLFYFPAPVSSAVPVKDLNFVKDLFQSYGLSVTALNNYLDCPWKYFYINLLRIPRAKNKAQMYGTAVHAALKDFFNAGKKTPADKKYLISSFKKHLEKEALSIEDFKESLKKGIRALSGYYQAFNKDWPVSPTGGPSNVLTEFNIPGIILKNNICITGTIDKIEIMDKKLGARVIDYKTSKPKTRGEIEGKTKNSNGDLKRQLVFYKLLLDNYKNGKKFKMKEGVLEFIEPGHKDRYHRERYIISNEEVAELKELIYKTAREILNLEFWDKFCDDKDCEYCALRKMMTTG